MIALFGGLGRRRQAATASSLTIGSSLNGAIDHANARLAITTTMGGDEQAFHDRQGKYGFQLSTVRFGWQSRRSHASLKSTRWEIGKLRHGRRLADHGRVTEIEPPPNMSMIFARVEDHLRSPDQ